MHGRRRCVTQRVAIITNYRPPAFSAASWKASALFRLGASKQNCKHVDSEGDPILDWPKKYKSLKHLIGEFPNLNLTREAAALLCYFLKLQEHNTLLSGIFSRFRSRE
jgi:hypothetical protein